MFNYDNNISNYVISEKNSKYSSIVFKAAKTIIIGIPTDNLSEYKDMVSEELLLRCGCICYNIPNYFHRMFSLSSSKREVISKITEYCSNNFGTYIHTGEQWDYLLGFIIAYYNINLSKVAKKYFGKYDTSHIELDKIEKMKKSESFSRNKVFAKAFCAYFMISPSFLDNGEGYFYMMKEEQLEEIHKRFNKDYFEKAIKNNDEFDLNQFLIKEMKYNETKDYSIYKVYSYLKTIILKKESKMIIDKLLDII